jgi:hypothetical protein
VDLVSQLLLLSFVFAVGYVVLVFQVVALSRLYQSTAWRIVAAGFILAGAMQVWRLIRFPLTMMQARVRGNLPEQLSIEQWINVSIGFLVVALLVIGFDKLRRDLRKIGI